MKPLSDSSQDEIKAASVLKSSLPSEVRWEIDDWFRCIGGALVQNDFVARIEGTEKES